MDLHYLKHNQIDFAKWDACVAQSRECLVYGLSWYLNVVAPGWEAIVQEESAEYKAVMPVPIFRKFNLKYIKQPFFCQQLGVFSGAGPENIAVFIRQFLANSNLISRYNFNTANLVAPIENVNFKAETHYTHHLHLNNSYENIYQQYSPDRKLNLKRAKKARLSFKESTDIKPLIQLFKDSVETRITGGVTEQTYRLLENLYQQLANRNLAILRYTYTQTGELDAGCLFVKYNGTIIYLFNAASIAGRNRNGRSLLIDNIIREYAGQNYIFDFESPAQVNAISRVYQGFGAKPVPYSSVQFNNLPPLLNFLKQTRKTFYKSVLATFKPVKPNP